MSWLDEWWDVAKRPPVMRPMLDPFALAMDGVNITGSSIASMRDDSKTAWPGVRRDCMRLAHGLPVKAHETRMIREREEQERAARAGGFL